MGFSSTEVNRDTAIDANRPPKTHYASSQPSLRRRAAAPPADFIENLVANLVEDFERLASIARQGSRRGLDGASYIDENSSM